MTPLWREGEQGAEDQNEKPDTDEHAECAFHAVAAQQQPLDIGAVAGADGFVGFGEWAVCGHDGLPSRCDGNFIVARRLGSIKTRSPLMHIPPVEPANIPTLPDETDPGPVPPFPPGPLPRPDPQPDPFPDPQRPGREPFPEREPPPSP